jgi:glycine cleavage system protein P-like pyridoxal-binding family
MYLGIVEEDIAKRLQDYGFHSPTMSFPVVGIYISMYLFIYLCIYESICLFIYGFLSPTMSFPLVGI